MKSAVTSHFPPVVFHKGKRMLWNRLRKQPLANRPEERVRLRFMDHLILDCRWPASRIASESPVENPKGMHRLRADLICYDRQMKPLLLVECKSEAVSLNEDAALQIARYNRQVGARWGCLTNGSVDRWYKFNSNRAVPLKCSPLQEEHTAQSSQGPDRTDVAERDYEYRLDPDYWRARGFLGSKLPEEFSNDLADYLSTWLIPGGGKSDNSPPLNHQSGDRQSVDIQSGESPAGDSPGIHYLDLESMPDLIPLNHFYRTEKLGNDNRIAVGFLNGPDGSSWLVALLSRNRETVALFTSQLDLGLARNPENGRLLQPGTGSQTIDIRSILPDLFEKGADKWPRSPGKKIFKKLCPEALSG